MVEEAVRELRSRFGWLVAAQSLVSARRACTRITTEDSKPEKRGRMIPFYFFPSSSGAVGMGCPGFHFVLTVAFSRSTRFALRSMSASFLSTSFSFFSFSAAPTVLRTSLVGSRYLRMHGENV